MAILYVKKNQLSPEDWFANRGEFRLCLLFLILGDDISPQFWEFINALAVRVDDMSEHQGYKGDMTKGASYYLNWRPSCSPDRNVECVFHVGPKMTEEEHRRLIGRPSCALLLFLFSLPDSQAMTLASFSSWRRVQCLTPLTSLTSALYPKSMCLCKCRRMLGGTC